MLRNFGYWNDVNINIFSEYHKTINTFSYIRKSFVITSNSLQNTIDIEIFVTMYVYIMSAIKRKMLTGFTASSRHTIWCH